MAPVHASVRPSTIKNLSHKRLPGLRIALLAVWCLAAFVLSFGGVTRTPLPPGPSASSSSSSSLASSVDHQATSKQGRGGRKNTPPFRYRASEGELYALRESTRLGFDERDRNNVRPSCAIWNERNASTIDLYRALHAYNRELHQYWNLTHGFESLKQDVRQLLVDDDACSRLDLVEGGFESIFQTSHKMLSSGSSFGYLEPILPPLRNPALCWGGGLMNKRYLLHDYSAFCRKLTPASKFIFVDLGASLNFHSKSMPILQLLDEYYKFGFRFDHIYGFEITPTEPADVVDALPEHLLASYHWINVGVSADPDAKTNPWKLIMQNFREEDFVVVKLDIDTPALESALVRQLLTNRNISKLIDVFYFEHHVLMKELFPYWTSRMKTTLKESMDMFVQLRDLGIASHSWI